VTVSNEGRSNGGEANSVKDLDKLEIVHHCQQPGSDFQRRARLLQSIWREQQGYEMGVHRGRSLGSRLRWPWAKETRANYLTETIREVVRDEVTPQAKAEGKLYGEPRVWNDLLSSQPLCFNLFGELKRDLALATAALHDLDGRVREVTGIEFEYSPGRSDLKHLGDRSAFDVFVRYETQTRGRGFLGIEVKYHEDLRGKPGRHRTRYEEVAREMGCFADPCSQALREMPLQQIWRDHLLAGATKGEDGYDEGVFVFLRPRGNEACAKAVATYRECLTRHDAFAECILEDVVEAIQAHTDTPWVGLFFDRYLDFGKVDAALAALDGA